MSISSRSLPNRYTLAVAGLLILLVVTLTIVDEWTSKTIASLRMRSVPKAKPIKPTVTLNTNINMTVPSSLEECPNGPRIEPDWTWERFSVAGQPRLLIAQYSGRGPYLRLLQLTTPMSRVYAALHGHDLAVIQGTTLALPDQVDGVSPNASSLCEPIPRRSIFNKIGILQAVLHHNTKIQEEDRTNEGGDFQKKSTKHSTLTPSKSSSSHSTSKTKVRQNESKHEETKKKSKSQTNREGKKKHRNLSASTPLPSASSGSFPTFPADYAYDYLLLLDADAVVYDLEFNVTSLFESSNDMLAAQVVHPEDMPHTFKINNGVTLWNLKHEATENVVESWHKRSVYGVTQAKVFHNDQFYLHQTLKQDKFTEFVRASDEPLHYSEATKIKHFIRHRHQNWTSTGVDERMELIEAVIADEICVRHRDDCQALRKEMVEA